MQHYPTPINSRCEPWGALVNQSRRAMRITRRQLAHSVGIDPSYVTLIERDGYVPKRSKVEALAHALDCDVESFLLTAGYSNAKVASVYAELKPGTHGLCPELRAQVKKLCRLPKHQQRVFAEAVSGLLRAATGGKS